MAVGRVIRESRKAGKPVDPLELIERIRTVLGRARTAPLSQEFVAAVVDQGLRGHVISRAHVEIRAK